MTLTRRDLLQRAAAGAAVVAAGGPSLAAAAPSRRLPAVQLRALKAAVRGQVLGPSDSGYNAARVLFNRRFDGVRPPAVVRVRDASDVQAVVRWANQCDVALTVRAGGHAYNGASTSATAVVVDVGALDRVSLASNGTATVGPGAANIDMYVALAARGATLPSGSCPTVGIGGLATGGGMGLAGRQLGLLLDRVTSIQVVTADGRVVTADADTNEDLFWALRGGGGSFGIVTSFQLQAYRVGSAAWFFATFPRTSANEALAAWDALAPGAPSALTSLMTIPGSGSVTALGQYFGSATTLARIVAPLTRVRGARMSSGTSAYLPLQRRWAGCADGSLAACRRYQRTTFDASSVYVAKPLSTQARSAFLAAADSGATLILDAYGGAIDDVSPSATAFVHRTARFSTQIASYAAIGTATSRVNRARRLIAPYGNGQAYQNYSDLDLANARTAYYGDNYARLQQIKTEVDPDNRFQPAQGIRPS